MASPYPPSAGAASPAPAPTLYGRRIEAYDKAVGLIREERYSEALAFIRSGSKDIRGWDGIMSLEAALLSQEDPQAALLLYDKILASESRGRHWARALAGYKFLLEALADQGDHAALFRLVKCLSFEWRNREARDMVSRALEDPLFPDPLREELSRLAAVLAMRHGDFAAAEGHFAPRADRSSLRWLSTLRVRQGDYKGAAAARRSAADTLKGAARTREHQRVLEILTKGGLPSDALALLEEFPELAETVPAWRYFLGIAHLSAREPDKALELFEAEETARGAKGERLQRASYFKGRALEMLLRHPEAAKAYEAAAAGPYGYYGLLAKGRLATLHDLPRGPAAPAARLAALLETPTGADRDSMAYYLWISERLQGPLPERAADFRPRGGPGEGPRARAAAFRHISMGDGGRAVAELKHTPQAVPQGAESSADELMLLAGLAADEGEYGLAARFLGRLPDPEKGREPPRRWNYPPAHAREVLTAWRGRGVPPQVTLAVIRTESAFNPDAVSASNARGLMQLLPSTAERIAQGLGEKTPREEDLFEPSLNIRYGTEYLAALLESFGSLPLALAAYNGGPFNIAALVRAREGVPADVFVECLPFAETSAYVRRAVESAYSYEAAYLGGGSLPDLTFPVARPRTPPPDF
jgi:soluble lytic murein transglycosylase-like protein